MLEIIREDALYTIDEKSTIRKSHENPAIKKLYKEFLEKQEVINHISYYIQLMWQEKKIEIFK